MEHRDVKEAKGAREAKEAKGAKEAKEAKEAKAQAGYLNQEVWTVMYLMITILFEILVVDDQLLLNFAFVRDGRFKRPLSLLQINYQLVFFMLCFLALVSITQTFRYILVNERLHYLF